MKDTYAKRLDNPLGLAQLDLVGYPNAVSWVVTRIIVPDGHREQGHATALLKECIADADREGIQLLLQVEPSGPRTYDELVAWYKRHGFVELEEGYLVRERQ